jgi:hypothetical protein
MAAVGYLYAGEATGARIIRTDIGFGQVGTAYNLDVLTWDERPLGDDGIGYFRWVEALVKHTAGYNLTVQGVVDGQPVGSVQNFSAGPPSNSAVEAIDRLRVWVRKRGNRIGVRVTTLTVLGYTELVDVAYSVAPIRTGL